MRTDSTNLSADAINDCRGFVEKEYGGKYLPEAPISYSSKEGAQEAHEAIRPSNVSVKPNQVGNVDRDAERLYNLIWRQFVACQMTKAKFLSTSVVLSAGDYELRTNGRVIVFDGYQKVLPPISKKDDDGVLPPIKKGELLSLVKKLGLVVRLLTRLLFLQFKIVVTFKYKIVVFMRRKWEILLQSG